MTRRGRGDRGLGARQDASGERAHGREGDDLPARGAAEERGEEVFARQELEVRPAARRRAELPIEVVQLAGSEDPVAELKRRFDGRSYRLDLRQAPPLRLCIAHDPAHNRWLALLLLHHLVADHTALDVLSEEIRVQMTSPGVELPPPKTGR